MIEFAQPFAWLLLPLPWLAWRFFPSRPLASSLRVPGNIAALFKADGEQPSRTPVSWPSGWPALLLGWLALVMALSGPYSRGAELLPPTGRDLVIALDLSSSMAETDMPQQGGSGRRIDALRQMVKAFIDQRQGDRLALIAFAQEAYLIAPLTFDTVAVSAYLDDLAIGLPGKRTDLGKAIGLAIKILQDEPSQARSVVLLSDGESNSGELAPDEVSALAADAGIRIHTIGFSPNAKSGDLERVAERTGGQFFDARSAQALGEVIVEIDKLEPTTIEADRRWLLQDWSSYALLIALAALLWRYLQERRRWS